MKLSKLIFTKTFSLFLALVAYAIINNNVNAYDIFQELNANNVNVRKEYLPVNDAFKPEFTFKQPGKLSVSIEIADEYYLYQHLIKVSSQNVNCKIENLDDGVFHHDDFMGDSQVYFKQLNFDVVFDETQDANNTISITYQGCTQGMCYPPVTKTLSLPVQNIQQNNSIETEQPIGHENKAEINIAKTDNLIDFGTNNSTSKDEENYSILSSLIFLLIGLSLSFTPCVFPMYPILSIVLFGTSKIASNEKNKAANFPLAFCFVQGIALTYTVIGILCSYIGSQTQAFLQQPTILIIFSLFFVVLSLSMMGLFDLEIPKFITNKLQNISEKQKSRSKIGAFIIGVITSLVCSPCTTAPVSASLLYTIQNGNVVSGSINLYLMGFGMGIPMLIIGSLGKKILPKSGNFLTTIKQLLGIVSLSVPIILLNRIIPNWFGTLAFALLVCSAIILVTVRHFRKLIFVVLPITIIAFSYFSYLSLTSISNNKIVKQQVIIVNSLEQLQLELVDKQFVIVDFYASWCTACKQYDEETFANNDVMNRMKNVKFIRIDLSMQNSETEKISSYFNLVGLPSVALIKDGEVQSVLSGFYDSKSFIEALNFYFK